VLLDVVHPDDRDRLRSVVEENPDHEWFVSCRVVHTNGSTKMVELHGFAPVDGKRAGICRDITDAAATQKRLRSSENLLNQTGRIARIGGWELDAETMVVSWTDVLFDIFELPLGPTPPLDGAIDLYHPADRPIIRAAVNAGLEAGESWDLELRVITAKGNEIFVRAIGEPVIENGRTIKCWGSLQDITELVNQKNRLEDSLRPSRPRWAKQR